MKKKYMEIIDGIEQNEQLIPFLKSAFWLVFLKQFEKKTAPEIEQRIRLYFLNLYTKIFMSLKTKVDQTTNILLFLTCFTINHIMYNSFKRQRHMLDQKFIFRTFHIVFEAIYGVLFSDQFLFKSFNRVFNFRKFFEYQKDCFSDLFRHYLLELKKNEQEASLRTDFSLKVD